MYELTFEVSGIWDYTRFVRHGQDRDIDALKRKAAELNPAMEAPLEWKTDRHALQVDVIFAECYFRGKLDGVWRIGPSTN